ncbi:DUF935 family protein, partial [Shewanella sp. KCT]|uniref:phage portal protein family protein n=1 Tax=Shewanella sp. KCT TaxID=2569535 RepID=UPI0011825CFE
MAETTPTDTHEDTHTDTLTDKNGTRYKVSEKQLSQPQTDRARLAHLQSHYASHPSRGLTPAKLAGLLQLAEQGD